MYIKQLESHDADGQNKIDDLLNRLLLLHDPRNTVIRALSYTGDLIRAGGTSIAIVDPYGGEESKIERYLRIKEIPLNFLTVIAGASDEILDPILHKIMLKPIKDTLNYTYDFYSMRTWLQQTAPNTYPRTPMTNQILLDTTLIRDSEMEDKILGFLEFAWQRRVTSEVLIEKITQRYKI